MRLSQCEMDAQIRELVIGNLGRIGDAWASREMIGHLCAVKPWALSRPLENLLEEGRIETKQIKPGRSLYRKTRDRTGSARRSINQQIWTSWKHISRFSGALTIGRVTWEFNFHSWQLPLRPRIGRSTERIAPWGKGRGFHTFHIVGGPLALIVRRWR